MLVVRVEIWPHGDKSKARELGSLAIENVGGDLQRGVYDATFDGEAKPSPVRRLQHIRQRGFWWLIMAALESAFYRDGARP